MTTWTNEDGLVVRFQGDLAAPSKVTKEAAGTERIIARLTDATQLEVNSTDPLTAGSTAYFHDEMAPSIPAGAYITNAYLVVDTAFTSGGSAVLDVGLMQADGTIIDVNGLDDGIAVASLTANTVINMDGASVAGTVKSSPTLASFVCFSYETAAFTAGACHVVVEYILI